MIKQLDLFKKENLMENSNTAELEVFIDGAARGNPGLAGAGIYVIQKSKNIPLIKDGFFLSRKTNNQAEYFALLLAAFLTNEKCTKLGLKNVQLTIFSDSELLVKQMSGEYKIKNETLQQLRNSAITLLQNFSFKFVHILREKNKIADKLANLGIDKKTLPPKVFLDFVTSLNFINLGL